MAEVLRFPAVKRAIKIEPDDTQARADALDTRSSCIVEAPAGSGKTGLLVQRYLKLLGDDSVEEPEEVLAITFTKKATAELRERVLEQLHAAKDDALPSGSSGFEQATRGFALAANQRSLQMGWGLLERPSRLNIRSIDSVCAEIANSLPLLSGGGGPRQPVEDAEPLYRQAARRTMLQLGGSDTALHEALRTVLLHRDGSLSECETLLAGMLRAREQWGELVPLHRDEVTDTELDEVVRARLERSLEGIVCAGLSHATHVMSVGLLRELTTMAAQFSEHPAYKSDVSPIAICKGRNDPPEAAAEHLEHWRALISLVLKKDGLWRKRFSRGDVGFEIPKAERSRLEDLVAGAQSRVQSDVLREALCSVRALPPAKYPDDQWAVAKALFHVLRRALAELRLLFAEHSACDFTELALSARAALRAEDGTSDAALAAGGRLRHLLVDEMQDTSSGQYELLDLLTRSWDGRTQTLFLVGDPKQSIYLFRQARVERFLRIMQERRLGDIELRPLHLTSNFRSQAALVQNFNDAFSVLFPGETEQIPSNSEGVYVPFIEANAVRPSTEDAGVVWHATVFHGRDKTDTHAVEEAREIRRIISARLATPLPEERCDPLATKPWRIAVLGRARSHLAEVIAEFKRNDGSGPIAFRAIDLDPLGELPEVLDALALTRALLHPSDRIAWLAVLHAPWCGLGIADLLALTGQGEGADAGATVATLVRERRAVLSESGRLLLERVWPVLGTAAATLGRTSLATHVARTWQSLGGHAVLTEEQRRNVMRYVGVLREVESDGGRVDLSALSSRLGKLYAEPGSGAAVNGVLPVELMTIHKAKGLEWDVVLVPGLERGGGRSISPLLNWLEFDGAPGTEEPASVVLAPIWQKGTDSDKLSSWLNGIRQRRERAERKRVFYVAATRAREEIHLFGAATRNVKGELAPGRWDSLLHACWPAASGFFELDDEMPSMAEQMVVSLREDDDADEKLSLAASGASFDVHVATQRTVQRLPLSFDPSAKFREAIERRLLYTEASALRLSASFERPEGSFAVRAFGNVVHRYLEVVSKRLDGGIRCEDLIAELPEWNARLVTSLRGEGLAPGAAAREAQRAERALMQALLDPVGRWILSPQTSAASEQALTTARLGARSLRVDRTFVAGDAPGESGSSCIWIIDFKTSEQGSRSDSDFEAAELAKYSEQLEGYASLHRQLSSGHLPICLGLFYPLQPRLIHWSSAVPVEAATI